jgi:hypothetical protein
LSNDGGALPDIDLRDGTITVGDLDLWSFSADPGFLCTIKLTKQSGGAGFTPKLEIFAPDGSRKAFAQDATAPTVSLATELGGSYTVLVSVGSTALVARFIGAGDRRLGCRRSRHCSASAAS